MEAIIKLKRQKPSMRLLRRQGKFQQKFLYNIMNVQLTLARPFFVWVGVWGLALPWFVHQFGSEETQTQCQSEGNDTPCTCFQHGFEQQCTKINKNVCNEQPLSQEDNDCVSPKKNKLGDF